MNLLHTLWHKLAQHQHADIPEVSAEEMKLLKEEDADVILLDVRRDDEWDEGHVEGAVHLCLDEVEQKAFEVLSDKNAKIICYCRAGVRSLKAAHILKEQGYTHLASQAGGITAWCDAGFDVVKT